jgi:hypothetical protein
VLPTRAYIAPQRLQSMSWKPAAFCRKVIEITPELVILWADNYSKACQLARRAKDWFRENRATADDVQQLLYTHYREPSPDFQAIIAPAAEDWIYLIGDVKMGNEFAAAGSGAQTFQTVVDGSYPYLPEGDTVPPDLTALSFSSALMGREILTSEPIYSLFGGGYEVLYRGSAEFIKIDDAMHILVLIDISNKEPEFWLCSPLLRQWYEGDSLYIISMSLTEHAQQGLESKGFVVPSVLGRSQMPKRTAEDLSTQPKYLCIHELFYNQRATQSFQFVIKDVFIKEYFTISTSGVEVTLSYIERLRSICESRRAEFP